LKAVCPNYSGEQFYRQEPAVTDGKLITASGIAPLEFAYQILKNLDVFLPQTLESWYKLYLTREAKYFYALMESIKNKDVLLPGMKTKRGKINDEGYFRDCFGLPKGAQFNFGINTNTNNPQIGFIYRKGIHTNPQHFSLDTNYVQVEFTDAIIKHPKQLFVVFLPFGAAMIGLGMAIIYQLRKIFATLTVGNPFVLENSKRMRKIGLLIFGGVLVELIAGSVIGKLIMDNVLIRGVTFSVKGSLNIGGIFFGLVILVLAEIFRQGALLKDEQDLTI
jgi:hypothetical protein